MTNLEKKVNSILRRLLGIEAGIKVLDLPPYNNSDNSFLYVVEDGVDKKIPLSSVQFTGDEATVDDVQANTDAIAVNTNNITSNTNNITLNTNNIASNTNNIASNTANIQTNTNDVDNLEQRVTVNEGNIQTNTNGIQANNSNIQQHNSQINTIQNNLQDVEFQADENTNNINTNGIISLNESFVTAGIDYTENLGITGVVTHIDDGSVLDTDKDCVIHYNRDTSDASVYVKKGTEFYNKIESYKNTIINMFNNVNLVAPIGINPRITRQPKEMVFQAIITRGTYQDFTIQGIDYRIYSDVDYSFSNEILNTDNIIVSSIVKATHNNKFQELSREWNGVVYLKDNSGINYCVFDTNNGIGGTDMNVKDDALNVDTKGFNFTKKVRVTGVDIFGKLDNTNIGGLKLIITADKHNDINQRTILFDGSIDKESFSYGSFKVLENMLSSVYENDDFTLKVFLQKKGGDNTTQVTLKGSINVFYKQID